MLVKQDNLKINTVVARNKAIASPSHTPYTPHPLLKLQRHLGNQAVSQLIQTKSDASQSSQSKQLILAEHQQYETIAHDLVYKSQAQLESEFPKSVLANNYDLIIKSGTRRFQAILLKPKPKNSQLKPMMAIRGTEPDTVQNFLKSSLINNFNKISVGEKQFKENESIIRELLDKAGDKVILTGHSLGGAVAQIITANNPGNIEKLVTFQSPGIDQATVEKFKKIPQENRPKEIVHHIVKGDLVDLAGEEHLPGQFFEHYLDRIYEIFIEVLDKIPLPIFKNNFNLYVLIFFLLLKAYKVAEAHTAFVLQEDSKIKQVKVGETYDYPIKKKIVEELRQIIGTAITELVSEDAIKD